MATEVVLITGCASGVGRHLAGALAARGHEIVATDVDEAALERAATMGRWNRSRVALCKLDVRREQEWEGALDAGERAFGAVSVLMNVAGFLQPAYVPEIGTAEMDQTIDVNLKGTILGTRAAARRMIARGAGHIVNVGSLAGLTPVPGLSVYSASKFAVRGFTLSAAVELRAKGVAVTLLMPDAIDTPMLDKQVPYDQAAMTFSGRRPLTVEDIERAVVGIVLPRRPLELAIPISRGLLARVATAAPRVVHRLAPLFVKAGKKRQAALRLRRG